MKKLAFIYIMLSAATALAQDSDDDAVTTRAQTEQNADAVTASVTRLELDTTSVTGNRELPKVLVIVPWKNPDLVELTGRPLASLVEEVLSPIDPDVFRRQVDYYNTLQEENDDAGDAAGKDK